MEVLKLISAREWGNSGCILGSTCTLCRARSIGRVESRTSGRRAVEDFAQKEELFFLKSLVEESAARALGKVLGKVKTPAVQASKIQQLEELENIKREN